MFCFFSLALHPHVNPAQLASLASFYPTFCNRVDGYDTTISRRSLVFVLILVLLLAMVVVVLLAMEVIILLLLAVVGQGLELGLGLGLLRTGARTWVRGLGLEDWG